MFGNVNYSGGTRNVFTKTPAPAQYPDQNPQLQALSTWAMNRAMQQPTGPRTPARPTGIASMRNYQDGPSSRGLRLQSMEDAAKMAQLQALTSPPPMRMVSGPGIIPGYMPDVNAMSGAQRQVFLPNQSGMTNVGTEDDTIRQARNNLGFQNFIQQGEARNMTSARGGGALSALEMDQLEREREAMRQRSQGKK